MPFEAMIGIDEEQAKVFIDKNATSVFYRGCLARVRIDKVTVNETVYFVQEEGEGHFNLQSHEVHLKDFATDAEAWAEVLRVAARICN